MKLSRNMRRRIRSLTRRQLLAYIFLDGVAKLDVEETPVKEMTKKLLGDVIVSWGWEGKAEDFYRHLRDAKALAASNDDLFCEFFRKHTPPMEDMVERQREIQLAFQKQEGTRAKSETGAR
ncbi:MAG: hypothetical protein GXP25_08590 [Planctomycetes bacterium]|nr:hypothetical protein [Planctomycetota bacterium]